MTSNPPPEQDPAVRSGDADATTAYPAQQPASGTNEAATAQYPAPSPGQYGAPPQGEYATPPQDQYAAQQGQYAPQSEYAAGAAPVEEKQAPVKRGTSDLGLLLLRLGLGAILLGHGGQQLFGLFDGIGIDQFTTLLDGAGYRLPEVSAYVAAIGAIAAGGLLVLGLLTPLAGAVALIVTINAWFLADLADPGFLFFVGNGGQEYEMLLVLLSGVVVLAGPGRYALDFGRGWTTRPFIGSFVALLIGIGGGLATWFVLNGTIPFS